MPSLDERREVAARLREQKTWDIFTNFEDCIGDLCDAVFEDEGDLNYMFRLQAALADLIEPEERTCRNIAEPDEEFDRPFTCSECGARGPYGNGTYHLGGCEEIDGRMCFWDSWPVWRFCPNCGAKVEGK